MAQKLFLEKFLPKANQTAAMPALVEEAASSGELRIANDGLPYSQLEFRKFYGIVSGEWYWDRAVHPTTGPLFYRRGQCH